jgi:hypothetical protein
LDDEPASDEVTDRNPINLPALQFFKERTHDWLIQFPDSPKRKSTATNRFNPIALRYGGE